MRLGRGRSVHEYVLLARYGETIANRRRVQPSAMLAATAIRAARKLNRMSRISNTRLGKSASEFFASSLKRALVFQGFDRENGYAYSPLRSFSALFAELFRFAESEAICHDRNREARYQRNSATAASEASRWYAASARWRLR